MQLGMICRDEEEERKNEEEEKDQKDGNVRYK